MYDVVRSQFEDMSVAKASHCHLSCLKPSIAWFGCAYLIVKLSFPETCSSPFFPGLFRHA